MGTIFKETTHASALNPPLTGLDAILRYWHPRSTNGRILSATLTVGCSTLAVYGATALKEVFVARIFGRGDALEAYLVAFAAQQFLIQVFAASFNTALIPTYVAMREEGQEKESRQLFATVSAWTVVVLLIICGAFGMFARPVFGLFVHHFGPEKVGLAASLFTMMLPAVFIRGLSKLWAAVLNAREQFALAALAPLWTPLLITISLLVWGYRVGAYAMAAGTVVGAIAEAATLAVTLRRMNISLLPWWHGLTREFRQVMAQYVPALVSTVLMSATVLVDQSTAALLPRGSVATLGYANNITFFVQSIAYISISTAVLPFFSQMIARNDWAVISHTLRSWSTLILAVCVPLTIVLVFAAAFLVRIAYQRGSFSAADTAVVAQVLRFYLLQIPFYVLGSLVVRLISSLNLNSILMFVTAGNLALKVGLNTLLLRIMGVDGIALATSIMYACSLFALTLAARSRFARRRASSPDKAINGTC